MDLNLNFFHESDSEGIQEIVREYFERNDDTDDSSFDISSDDLRYESSNDWVSGRYLQFFTFFITKAFISIIFVSLSL